MRQFIASEQLKENTIIAISEKEVHYLKNVLRLKPGESIDVRLLDGSLLEMALVKKNTKWLLQKVLGAKKKKMEFLQTNLIQKRSKSIFYSVRLNHKRWI